MEFKILSPLLLDEYRAQIKESPLTKLDKIKEPELTVDYFDFYKSVSSVYSSKIEGEEIDFDSYYKHKFLKVKFKAEYTKKTDDLFAAYGFIERHPLNKNNVLKAHSILSAHLLPRSQRGKIRVNPMFVINSEDKIEYAAAPPDIVERELTKFFDDLTVLKRCELNVFEIFYYAAMLHLVFVKIHPFQDGNGRTARLIEKWFLLEHIGRRAAAVQLEKNYFKNINEYYRNIRKIGLEYEKLDYSKALDFLLMTAAGLDNQ